MRMRASSHVRGMCTACTQVRGNLNRFAPVPGSWVGATERVLYWDGDRAALTVLRPLLQPDAARDARAPAYFVPIGRERGVSMQAADTDLARRLWAFSSDLVRGA